MTVSSYVKLQNLMNNKLIKNYLSTMAIVVSTKQRGPLVKARWLLAHGDHAWMKIGNRKPKSRNRGSFWYAISPIVGKNPQEGNPQALDHEENRKLCGNRQKAGPVPKTGRISLALLVVSGSGQVQRNTIHYATRVQRMRQKTAYIAWVTDEKLTRVI